MDNMNLFVSGGTSGIGRSVVLAALHLGWNVAFSYYTQQARAEQMVAQANTDFPQQECKAYPLDVSDSNAVERMGDQVLADFSRIEAIVCNAGRDVPGNLVLLTNEEWEQVLNTNLSGTFYLIRYFLPALIANKYGRIVTLSSLAKDGSSGQAAYSTSKAGLVGLTKATAKEYGRFGITANVIVPGLIETEMIDNDLKGLRDFFTQYCPEKKLGSAADVANTIMFLIGRHSGYVNGAVINVTGGIDWVY